MLLQSLSYDGVPILWHSEFNHILKPCKQHNTHRWAVQVNFNSLNCVFVFVNRPR